MESNDFPQYTRTPEKERLKQEADEKQLLSFFDDRQIKAKKLRLLKGASSADFELLINSKNVIVELKSRFDDNSYNKLLDFIKKELSTIRAGYDCSIYLDFRHKMNNPCNAIWDFVKKEFSEKIESIDNNTSLPMELSFCLQDESRIGEDEIERFLYRLENNLTITIENKNDFDYIRFTAIRGSSRVFDAKWICDHIEEAAPQLRTYDPNFPKGVFFINNPRHEWGYQEQLSPFFIPTCFINIANNNKDLIVSRIEQESILRSDNLNLISFYGFVSRTGGKITELDLFINCYGNNKLSPEIIKKFKSFVHRPTPKNRHNMALIIREFQR